MFKRQRTGSVVCPSCGRLVGVQDDRCYSCGRLNPGLWGFARAFQQLDQLGFATTIVGVCGALYLVTLLASGAEMQMRGLFSFLSPSPTMLFLFGASGAVPVFGYGRWWTVLSAGWLHGGLLHILFNAMWIRQLGSATADLFGTSRMVIIYTVSGVTGFALTSLAGATMGFLPFLRGAGLTIGASAPIFGLLGALVYYGRRGSSLVRREALGSAVTLFVFGLIMPGVDNYAHAGGFAGGYITARLLNPFGPERVEYAMAAVACVVLSAAAIVASLVHGLMLPIR